ncbi:MAG: tRNA pseudouridine(55) synthase TruB, partial [Burkholderiales bacterium]|nr:tRNA pseudouridine(55) synthase TruB [Burkholderiales bacterium]
PVTVYTLEVLRIELPLVQIRIEVSKGTYIRSLAEEIGRRLACGAHLTTLRRERVGPFGLDQAVTPEQLASMNGIERLAHVRPTDTLLAGMPRIDLDERSGAAMRQGRVVRVDGASAGLVRMYDHAGAFIGVGRAQDDACVAPQRLLQTA